MSQGEARHGTAEPQIEIRLPKGTSQRLVSAALHKLAADIELATPERERWIVRTESFYDARSRGYLKLANTTPTEAERGRRYSSNLSAEQARPDERLFPTPTGAPCVTWCPGCTMERARRRCG